MARSGAPRLQLRSSPCTDSSRPGRVPLYKSSRAPRKCLFSVAGKKLIALALPATLARPGAHQEVVGVDAWHVRRPIGCNESEAEGANAGR